MDDTRTQLLTLLNVSALKRKRTVTDQLDSPKLNKKVKPAPADESAPPIPALVAETNAGDAEEIDGGSSEDGDEKDTEVTSTPYQVHFASDNTLLSESVRNAVDQHKWSKCGVRLGKLGLMSQYTPEGTAQLDILENALVPEKLRSAYDSRGSTLSADHSDLRANILSAISSYRDLFISGAELDHQPVTRDAITLHVLDHVYNIRRRVLKNNDRLTNVAKDLLSGPPNVQDQGFTRPSILVVLPFRSSALQWVEGLLSHMPSHQVENRSRFMSEFSLPPDAIDKLASAEPGTYPRDHVEMFKGNVDDNFRVGIKLTKKSVKIFANFYGCDIIIASPVGLRMSIEKEKSSDFLSSIEVLVVDQMDAITMQNWEHFLFLLERLNQIPKESHDADFSRVKPWYLDGHATYLRQSILISPYETPEMRSLFNRRLKNLAGKLKTERTWNAVDVPEAVEQNFTRFDCSSPEYEADKRFEYFTTQMLPSIRKSAVQSTNTLIFVPSSFDFIRVHNHLRKMADVSFTILSEYSSNQDISRARQAFFGGRKSFLLMSERFHFFRRYRIRGIRNILFYAPPDHPQFYTELLSYPFLDSGVDASDILCRVLYCKYDYLRLERLAGTEGVKSLVQHH